MIVMVSFLHRDGRDTDCKGKRLSRMAFLSYFFTKKIALCQGVEWYVARTDQIAAFRYVSRTNQMSELGYVSHTNQIAALGYVSRTQHLDILHQSQHLRYYLAPVISQHLDILH